MKSGKQVTYNYSKLKKILNLLWFRSEVHPQNFVLSWWCYWKVIGWWGYWPDEWMGSSLNGLSGWVETVKGDYEWIKWTTRRVPDFLHFIFLAARKSPTLLPWFHLATDPNNESRWPWMKTSEMMTLSASFLLYVGYMISNRCTCQRLGWYTGKFHSSEC